MKTEKSIGLDDLPKFKRAYNKAVKEGKSQFTYEGSEVLVTYAKYAIEYLTYTKDYINGRKKNHTDKYC